MSEQIKRWNIPRGTTVSESPNGEFYHCSDFDTLAQRLQEAERLLGEVAASLAWNAHGECRAVHDGPIIPSAMAVQEAKAFLSGKGGKP